MFELLVKARHHGMALVGQAVQPQITALLPDTSVALLSRSHGANALLSRLDSDASADLLSLLMLLYVWCRFPLV